MNAQTRMRRLALGVSVALMAASPGAVALAQPYGPGPYAPSPYDDPRANYDAQYGPGAYDRYMANQQARAYYDAQYGPGAYDRYQAQQYAGYAQTRGYDDQRAAYDAQYGPGAYDRYMADQQARAACHDQRQGNEVLGGVLGGVAGAVIGSNVTRGGGREGGAIIGGAAGAVAGSQIAKGQTNCDNY